MNLHVENVIVFIALVFTISTTDIRSHVPILECLKFLFDRSPSLFWGLSLFLDSKNNKKHTFTKVIILNDNFLWYYSSSSYMKVMPHQPSGWLCQNVNLLCSCLKGNFATVITHLKIETKRISHMASLSCWTGRRRRTEWIPETHFV